MMKSNDRPLGEASQNTSLTFRKHRSRAVYIYVIMSRNIHIYIHIYIYKWKMHVCTDSTETYIYIFRCIYTTYTYLYCIHLLFCCFDFIFCTSLYCLKSNLSWRPSKRCAIQVFFGTNSQASQHVFSIFNVFWFHLAIPLQRGAVSIGPFSAISQFQCSKGSAPCCWKKRFMEECQHFSIAKCLMLHSSYHLCLGQNVGLMVFGHSSNNGNSSIIDIWLPVNG